MPRQIKKPILSLYETEKTKPQENTQNSQSIPPEKLKTLKKLSLEKKVFQTIQRTTMSKTTSFPTP
ncbi:hypothetical protein JCM12825_16850 [Desulfurobacterium crinifex]